MPGDVSPVKAPSVGVVHVLGAPHRSCVLDDARKRRHGGTRTADRRARPGRRLRRRSGTELSNERRAASAVLYIFQLPAMSGRLPAVVAPSLCSMSASTPGRARPSRNSREAPPPVETCVSARPGRISRTAATESPPPTTVTARVARRWPRHGFVPAANVARSRTRPSARSRRWSSRRAARRDELGRRLRADVERHLVGGHAVGERDARGRAGDRLGAPRTTSVADSSRRRAPRRPPRGCPARPSTRSSSTSDVPISQPLRREERERHRRRR